jgi:4-amino-4-deoxy-L-arabinose transferase-like glycosyltransferase
VFADGPGRPYNPDHPPLGRLWLGMWHDFARWLWPPVETGALTVTACARVGSAMAFGLTVWLVGTYAGRWFGPTAGWSGALAYALMPRVFGHAHLAALETCMNLAFLAPILFVGQKWGGTNPADGRPLLPKREWACAVIAGVLIGAAFLTKIQAVLLPIPIAVWTLARWRWHGLAWLSVAGVVTAVVFLIGWPWCRSIRSHVREFLGRGLSVRR